MEISENLKKNYDTQYSNKSEEWRRIGANGKVDNIVKISKDLGFNKIVDIEAGDGNMLSALSNINYCKEYYAAEISDSAIKQIKKKNNCGLKDIKQFDGYLLPFKDKEFDIATCSHVIEHVKFPRQLLREIKRISKNQIFEVPIDFAFNIDKKFIWRMFPFLMRIKPNTYTVLTK